MVWRGQGQLLFTRDIHRERVISGLPEWPEHLKNYNETGHQGWNRRCLDCAESRPDHWGAYFVKGWQFVTVTQEMIELGIIDVPLSEVSEDSEDSEDSEETPDTSQNEAEPQPPKRRSKRKLKKLVCRIHSASVNIGINRFQVDPIEEGFFRV